ncbi:MAG: 2-dehydropantoate 2-reductase N-terminal domain-containing protein [Pseudomonadota bacterium]|nr:2-dehydropantoate 2-reductase N-terminal domain-containing protein [Pseudomonadota bacterium]
MRPLSIGIIGAGNIGTAMAALIAQSGAAVTLVARGERLARVARDGVTLDDRGTLIAAHVTAVEALSAPMDAVFLCVKSHDAGRAVAANAAGIGPGTLVIPMVNGLPFWFGYDTPGAPTPPFTDPDGSLSAHLTPSQIVGAVLMMTVTMTTSGRAVSSNTPTLHMAPVAGGTDLGALGRLIACLNAGGIKADVVEDLRARVLTKLLANLATNPLSAVTGDTLAGIGRDDTLRPIALTLATEFRDWAATQGYTLPDNDWLAALLLDAGEFETSMLQDARAGRPLELDTICRAPRALAETAGLAMPTLTRLMDLIDTGPRPLPLTRQARTDALATLTASRRHAA